MAKGILEFNLDDHSDKLSFRRASSATDAYIILFEVSNKLFREILKYREDLSDESMALVQQLSDDFHVLLDHYGVDLNDLE